MQKIFLSTSCSVIVLVSWQEENLQNDAFLYVILLWTTIVWPLRV